MSTYIFYKNGGLERPKNVPKATYATDAFGTQYLYSPIDNPINKFLFSGSYTSQDYKKIYSLKNIINYYKGVDDIFNFNNFYNTPVALICLASNHLGSGIKKNSIELKYYQSGSLLDTATDKYENGVLYNKNNEKIGIALYKEGFYLINNTGSLSNNKSYFNSYYDNPRWTYFLMSTSDDVSYENNFIVKNQIPTTTWFCEANKYRLNHSNNMSYLKYIYDEVEGTPPVEPPVEFLYSLNFSVFKNTFYIAGI